MTTLSDLDDPDAPMEIDLYRTHLPVFPSQGSGGPRPGATPKGERQFRK